MRKKLRKQAMGKSEWYHGLRMARFLLSWVRHALSITPVRPSVCLNVCLPVGLSACPSARKCQSSTDNEFSKIRP